MQNKQYLDKINNMFNNTESVTIIVTTIIIITIIVFILVIYNFLSKASTNCKNIEKKYKTIFNINKNSDDDDFYSLNKSQDQRTIDISFSCTLSIQKNWNIKNKFNSLTDDSLIQKPFHDFVIESKLQSNINTITLEELNNISFADITGIIDTNNIVKYFNYNIINAGDKKYFKFDCSQDLKTSLTTSPSASGSGADFVTANQALSVALTAGDEATFYTSYSGLQGILVDLSNINVYDVYAIENINTPNEQYYIGISNDKIYIPEELIKLRQGSIKYSYSIIKDNLPKIDKNSSSRDIELLNNDSNIQQSLNKIHNNYILTAFNCCNSGEYQNNYVDTCILKKCLVLGVRCLDFQVFNYSQKPIIASSTQNSLYIKETFNYLEIDTVLYHIIDTLNNSEKINTSPLFLHFRVMSLSEKIYKTLIEKILIKLGENNKNSNFSLVTNIKDINNVSLNELKNKIVVFINPYYTSNNLLIDKIDEYTDEIKIEKNIIDNFKIYKSGYITTPSKDLILYNNNNYEIHKESHNKTKLTIVLPDNINKINDDSFMKFMKNKITFICMKFQEIDNYLQIARFIFSHNDNNSGFLLKKSIDTSVPFINLQNNGVEIIQNDLSLP